MRISSRRIDATPPAKPAATSAARQAGQAAERDRVALSLPLPDAALIRRALAGEEVRFQNDQGGEAVLRAAKTGEGRYRLTLDGKELPVKIDAGLPAEEALARIADYQSQLPAHMREGLREVEVTNRKKDGAAATAYGGKRVVFWDGMTWLKPNVYFHELGHVNAQRVYGHTDPSDAWDRAQDKDGRNISDYSKTNDNEDFSEMMEAYWMARRGEGAFTLEELRQKFPERMKIIEDVVAGKPVDTKDSDYWVVAGFDIPKPRTIWREIDGPSLIKQAKGFLKKFNPFD